MGSKNTITFVIIFLIAGAAYYFYHINSAEYRLDQIVQKTCDSHHVSETACHKLKKQLIKKFNSTVAQCERVRNDGNCEEKILKVLERSIR